MENKTADVKLYDRADGVKGHFCVGRSRGDYSEYWTGKGFGGFGKLYTSEKDAKEIADLLNASLQCAEKQKEIERLKEMITRIDKAYWADPEPNSDQIEKLLKEALNPSHP